MLLLFCSAGVRAAPWVDVAQTGDGQALINLSDVYEDTSRLNTIADMVVLPDSEWQLLTEEKTAYPITDSRFWMRVRLENTSNTDVQVVLQHPTAFIQQLVLFDQAGTELSRSSGQIKLEDRAVYDFLPAVVVTLGPAKRSTFYVLISQFYAEPMIASLKLYSDAEHRVDVIRGLSRDGFIIATLMAFAIIMLVFAVMLRRARLYLFVLYLFGLGMTISYYTGIARWLFPVIPPPRLEPVFPFFYLLAIASLVEFSIRHLALRQHLPKVFVLYRGLSISFLLCATAIVLGVPNSLAVFFGIPLFFMPSLFALVGWWIYWKKQRERYLMLYSSGMTVYAMGMMILGFFIFSGHPFAMEMHHQGLWVAYTFITLDMVLLIASIAIWLNEEKYYRQVAETEAQHDPLTGLLNRRGYQKKVAALLATSNGTPIWVATLDLDHFKRINDAHSHAGGDVALMHVAQLLQRNSRDDQVVARFGGEEFVILFCAETSEGALAYMNRLRQNIARNPARYNNKAIPLTVSIGLARLAQPDWALMQEALDHSDQALYEGKQAGRDQVVVFSSANA